MGSLQSILLMGPTGSGKTPLGKFCEANGVREKKCAHFDFGKNLRRIADNGFESSLLTKNDLTVVKESLKTGSLLENENFHIARKILQGFIEETNFKVSDLLLLNGMPRHIGQANDMDGLVEMVMVLCLKCSPEVIHERIKNNSGGDRVQRIDDSVEEIERKIKIFDERTLPLLDYYRRKGVMVEVKEVAVSTTAEEMHKWLSVFR
ncbi:MAG: nucleoside monophosphate kinase [Chloroflexi bacterium]|nr:nucleoside monophosphate kinase [Chloroflexota bacterium]